MTGWLEGASQAPPGQRCHFLEEDAKGTVAGGVTWATLPSVLWSPTQPRSLLTRQHTSTARGPVPGFWISHRKGASSSPGACHGEWGCSGDGGRRSATHTAVAPLHAGPGLEERGQEALC